MLNELEEIVDEWRDLGLALDLPYRKIRELEANHPNDVKKCLEGMIKVWLESEADPSWQALCTALRTELVDCNTIAQRIEERLQ